MTSSTLNRYALTGPCKRCPFRVDMPDVVRPERAVEIAERIRSGSEFVCHKTTVAVDGEDANGNEVTEMVEGPNAMFCGGALATMEAGGEANQMMRVAERLGLYDPEKVDTSLVYGSLTEWVRSHFEDTGLEYCDVVGDDCIDPPGYSMGGGAFASADPPTCDPDNSCGMCGRVMCEECTGEPDEDGYLQCVMCAADEEEEDDDDAG